MAASIFAAHRARKDVPQALAMKWKSLTALMFSFLAGYIVFVLVQIYNIQFPLALFVSVIFFAGGLFVFLAINLSRTTIADINEHILTLAELNKNLDKQVAERTRELQNANIELDQIFNTITDGLRIIDKDYNIIQVNDTFRNLSGFSEDEILGRKCHEVFTGGACNGPDCPFIRILQGEKHIESEVEKTHKNGTLISCIVTAIPHLNSEGELLGIIETFKDITLRKKMEQELIASLEKSHTLTDELKVQQKELYEKNLQLETTLSDLKKAQSHLLQQEKMASVGQLAAGIAHEINNPMGFISSNLRTLEKYTEKFVQVIDAQSQELKNVNAEHQAEELKKQLQLDFVIEDTRDLITETLDGAKRVSDIVQNLKTFSRMDEAQYKAADINEILESTIKVIWNELKYKAQVIKDYGELTSTQCYPQELSQVFMNILMNAAHAIQETGEITVKTWQESDTLYVTVSDTGQGIPAENIAHLFEPFFTTKDVGKGTGLGLSITHDIIQKHHGEISVASEVGKGTTFSLKLPIAASENG